MSSTSSHRDVFSVSETEKWSYMKIGLVNMTVLLLRNPEFHQKSTDEKVLRMAMVFLDSSIDF